MDINSLYNQSVELLTQLIATPSFSKEEDKTAAILEHFFQDKNISANRHLNNVWCFNKFFDKNKSTILLNSHHDTVKPNPHYTKDPFQPFIEEGKLYGLGSNDAGGPLVSLIAAFLYFYDHMNLRYNIAMAATAEEEISGKNGIECIISSLSAIEFAIVGEPTNTQLAVAEKGLLVLDCTVQGIAGHAARGEGDNAIYKAFNDIEWFRTFPFPKVSESLGRVKMSVTVMNTENKAHNVVPPVCSFVVDIRVTDVYSHEEILGIIQRCVSCDVKPRSLRLRSSKIDTDHPLVQAGIRLGKIPFGSLTTSDKALIPAPSLKCGPGDSARSHTADEYIYLHEIKEGIETYINILKPVLQAEH